MTMLSPGRMEARQVKTRMVRRILPIVACLLWASSAFAADVTLLNGDLQGIVRAFLLSRAVMHNVRQNLFLAFVYNVIGIPIAAGALYPVFGLVLPPAFAALAMSLSSVSVVTNALRLRRTRLD